MADGHWFFRDWRRARPAQPEQPAKSPKHLRKSGSYEGRISRPLGLSEEYSTPKHAKKPRPPRVPRNPGATP